MNTKEIGGQKIFFKYVCPTCKKELLIYASEVSEYISNGLSSCDCGNEDYEFVGIFEEEDWDIDVEIDP